MITTVSGIYFKFCAVIFGISDFLEHFIKDIELSVIRDFEIILPWEST